MKNYLSFGGGVNSVALYLLMQDLDIEFEAIFVDHGGDYPFTYEYVDYFINTGRPITIIKTEERLYDYSWNHQMVPSMLARWCTRLFKIKPIENYIKTPCFMHLGIDAGESHRAKMSSTKGVESRWLLIENNIDREGCIKLIQDHGINVPPKSGCFFCPYQRKQQWKNLRKSYPNLFCKAQKLEKRNIDYRKSKGKKAMSLRNDGITLDKLINDKQSALPGLEDIEYPPCQCGL